MSPSLDLSLWRVDYFGGLVVTKFSSLAPQLGQGNAKDRAVQSRLPVPFLLENIAYVFDWPDSALSDAEFFDLICGETGARMLLDVENHYLNAQNHGVDAYAFLDALPSGCWIDRLS